MQNSYAHRERGVLNKICDMSKGIPGEIIVFEFLVKELRMTDDEVSGICKGLAHQGYIEWPGGDVLEITSLGIHALESRRQERMAGGDTYTTHIGTIHGAAQIGSSNVQNVKINVANDPEFAQAIAELLELIRASWLPDEEIEELQDEVIRLNKLALSEANPRLLERAKARIEMVKVGLQGTDVLIKAAPLLQTLWDSFSK
jgi:hypothetical protein